MKLRLVCKAKTEELQDKDESTHTRTSLTAALRAFSVSLISRGLAMASVLISCGYMWVLRQLCDNYSLLGWKIGWKNTHLATDHLFDLLIGLHNRKEKKQNNVCHLFGTRTVSIFCKENTSSCSMLCVHCGLLHSPWVPPLFPVNHTERLLWLWPRTPAAALLWDLISLMRMKSDHFSCKHLSLYQMMTLKKETEDWIHANGFVVGLGCILELKKGSI